jgi:hypothetical protein
MRSMIGTSIKLQARTKARSYKVFEECPRCSRRDLGSLGLEREQIGNGGVPLRVLEIAVALGV